MKTMKTITSIFAFLMVLTVNAQWNPDTAVNTEVNESEPLDMLAEGTSTGETYVVFWKSVGPPTNIELRMQVMDADGNKTLGADGMLVSDQIPMSTFTVISTLAVDADDNLYIGVTGTGGGDPAYAFKMDSSGNHLWGANGVNVGSGYSVTTLPLSTGEAIVSWLEGSEAVMQKYDASGTPIWATPTTITSGSGSSAPGNFFEISGENIIAVFHQRLTGITSNLYAQRFDADGNAVWANAVQLSTGLTSWNRGYVGVQDGDVVYMAYSAAENNRFDSYLQRVNPDGTLPWNINGADFDDSNIYFETGTRPAFEEGSDHIWAVSRYTNFTQTEAGTFAQKFDKNSGAPLLTSSGKELFAVGSDIIPGGSLHLLNGTPFFIVEKGENNGATPITIDAVYLDENADFAWLEETRPVGTFEANKGRSRFTAPVDNQSVALWVENKGSGAKIYAQNVIDDTAGVDDFTATDVFFTNPVKNEMLVKSNSAIEAVSIYNVLGQQIVNTKFNGENEININTQSWNSGIYFMNVSTNGGMKNGIKLIKQ